MLTDGSETARMRYTAFRWCDVHTGCARCLSSITQNCTVLDDRRNVMPLLARDGLSVPSSNYQTMQLKRYTSYLDVTHKLKFFHLGPASSSVCVGGPVAAASSRAHTNVPILTAL